MLNFSNLPKPIHADTDVAASVRFAEVLDAAARIAPLVPGCTPVLRVPALDALSGARLVFKCEHLQRGGAFKFRGASNAVMALAADHAQRGVITHSSGNHGTALALAAQARGLPCYVVVPDGAPQTKVDAIAAAGAQIRRCPATVAARQVACTQWQAQTGAHLVHPFENPYVIAGQGTAALELLSQTQGLDAVVVPVGGGGLASGTAVTLAALAPTTQLFLAEPSGADDAFRSLREGVRVSEQDPDTFCDGLRTTLGRPNFAILQRHGAQVLPVSDAQTRHAMHLLWRVAKQLIEPSSATVLAAVLAYPQQFAGQRVGLILSGGNVDLPG